MAYRARRPVTALLTLLITAALAAAAPAAAPQQPATVTPSQLRELRAEVNRLDDAMQMVRDDNPRAREFRDREKRIREDLQWLRDEMLKHAQDERFDSLVLGSQTVHMDARVVDMKQGGVDKRHAGLGAVVGGVLGAVLDGAKGAVVGAILGGGGAVVASSGQDVELPAGTLVTVRLERPLRAARR